MFDPVFSVLFLMAVICPMAAIVYLLKPERRSAQVRTIAIICAVAGPVAFLLYVGPVLLVSNKDTANVYVLTPDTRSDKFTDELGSIIARYGFSQNAGRSTDDKGLSYYVMNGTGHWLWLWSTNVPLSGEEAPDACGQYAEGHPDPGQYVLMVSRIMPFGTKARAQEFLSKISFDLKAKGFEVRSAPVMCSPISKLRAPH